MDIITWVKRPNILLQRISIDVSRFCTACCLVSAALLGKPLPVSAQLQADPIFSSHMVLQQQARIPVWGKAAPGTQVTVSLGRHKATCMVKQDSTWQVLLGKLKASSTPLTLTVQSARETLVLDSIVVGDVWLCLGQSNMEFPLRQEKHWSQEKQQASHPMLRLYNPWFAGKYHYGQPSSDSVCRLLQPTTFFAPAAWHACDSAEAAAFSAVGYYFGTALLQAQHTPVGLINLSVGGSPIEAFIPAEALSTHAQFSEKMQGNWLSNDALPVWVRSRARENLGEHTTPGDALGPNHAFKPGFLNEAVKKTLQRFPVKGILWYQGESNAQEAERVAEYGALQQLLVQSLREYWNQPKLPFYWVQLSSIDTARYRSQLWPAFRNEQYQLLQHIPHGGMAVSMDAGALHDVHPTNKQVIGQRLARWALQDAGKEPLPSGPLPRKAVYAHGKIIIHFRYATATLATADHAALRGFSLNGKDACSATIDGDKVVIVTAVKPERVYYGWQPYTNANLVNSAALPAPCFAIPVR